MMHDVKMGKRTRKSFSHISEVLEMPDLIEVQKNSYYHFLKEDLREVFNDISPIVDFSGKLELHFVDYRIDLDKPKYSIEESKSRDVNYAAPLLVTVRLHNTETDVQKQQEVFMGDFPLMTPQGTFIINGAERVIGYGTNDKILDLLGNDERLDATLAKDPNRSELDGLFEIYRRQRPGEPPTEESARNLLHGLFFDNRYDLARVGRYKYNKKLALKARIRDQIADEIVINEETGEILVEEGQKIDRQTAEAIQNAGINAIWINTEEHGRVKVVGNNFASAAGFLPFAPIEAGLNEDVHIPTLKKLLNEAAEKGIEGDNLKDFLREHYDELIPRHIIPDDMVASIRI